MEDQQLSTFNGESSTTIPFVGEYIEDLSSFMETGGFELKIKNLKEFR